MQFQQYFPVVASARTNTYAVSSHASLPDLAVFTLGSEKQEVFQETIEAPRTSTPLTPPPLSTIFTR